MRLRDLESALQCVRPFDTAVQKIELEQFPTSPHIAACVVHTAESNYGDIEDKVVLDLGTGTGMLGIGCVMMGASRVFGVDADMDALAIAQANIEECEVDDTMELLLCDVSSLPIRCTGAAQIDTVIMNPPFGTRNKGIDSLFLEKAISLRPRAIYSLHKTSTRKFLLKQAIRWGVKVDVLAELAFNIPKVSSKR